MEARKAGGREEVQVIPDIQDQPTSGQKRKSDRNTNDGARVRDFRRELNNRPTMPPPPPPQHPPESTTPQDVRERELPQQQKQVPQQEQPTFIQSYDKHLDAMNLIPAFQSPANPYNSSSSARTFSNASHSTQQFQQNSFIQPPRPFSSRETFSVHPSTPRHQQPFFNTPFRLPTRPETPIFRPSHQQQPESNFFSYPHPRPQLQKMISPTGNPGGRLSLAPQSSHGVNNNGGYMGTRISSTVADRPGTSSPYLTRSPFGRAKIAGPGMMFSRGGTETLDVLREKMGSRLGTSQGAGLRFGMDGSGSRGLGTSGGGGLNELLTSGEGFVERSGLRRAVRRE
ncbi:hypothetical protein EX30DRAFT_194999 [Ascodesmis nigricans]|uniref:Uncharacterized protein n=1 Tax=Ascodesmis nigricans TaxID=341454 RepID=A0A4S2MKR9_9PEZI|nr:hypothetical protein EX30DRAFT_194999 [Ascodesmis nigricans]